MIRNTIGIHFRRIAVGQFDSLTLWDRFSCFEALYCTPRQDSFRTHVEES